MLKIYLSALLLSLYLLSDAQGTCDTAAINTYLGNAGFSRVYVPQMPCSRYYYNPTTQYGIDAHRTAANLGVPLLVINNAFEDSVVSAALYAQGIYNIAPEVWLGITDSATTFSWRTFDGSALPAYTNWESGEPNNLYPSCKVGNTCAFCFGVDAYWCANGEDCAVMAANGQWIDNTCQGTSMEHLTVLEVNTCPVLLKPIDTTICAGSSVTVRTAASGGSKPYTYSWNPGNLVGLSQTLTPGATTTLTIQVTDRFSCTTDSSVTITVNPNVPVANAGPDIQVCPGGIDTLGMDSTIGYTYLWSPAWGLSSATSANPTFTVSGNPRSTAIDTTFILTATLGICSAYDTVNVTLYPSVNNNFTATPTACGSNDVTVVYSGTPSGTATYTWGFDSATTVSGSGAGTYVLSWPTTGTKTITLNVTDHGCTASPVSQTVNVYPKPTAVITSVVHALQTSAFSSYQWLENGTAIPNATTRSILATSNGSYQVVVVDSNGCSDTSAVLDVTGVGISEISSDGQIRIYPNPTTGAFTIETHNAIGAELTITDIIGTEISRQTITMDKQPVKLQGIAVGEYFITIKLNGTSYTSKVIIENE